MIRPRKQTVILGSNPRRGDRELSSGDSDSGGSDGGSLEISCDSQGALGGGMESDSNGGDHLQSWSPRLGAITLNSLLQT